MTKPKVIIFAGYGLNRKKEAKSWFDFDGVFAMCYNDIDVKSLINYPEFSSNIHDC